MYEELPRVEHLPPVREAVVRNAAVQQVRHEAVRQFAPRPIVLEIALTAFGPLAPGGIEDRGVRGGRGEAPTVRGPPPGAAGAGPSGESVALPPYSFPSGPTFGAPASHCGCTSSDSSIFLFLPLPSLVIPLGPSMVSTRSSSRRAGRVSPQCGHVTPLFLSRTANGASVSAMTSGTPGAMRASSSSMSKALPHARQRSSHTFTAIAFTAITG